MPLNDAYERREDELYEMTPSALRKVLSEKGVNGQVEKDGAYLDSKGRLYTEKEWLVRNIMRLEFPLGL